MASNKVQRNDKCPCGSGLKHKNCHGDEVLADMALKAAKIVAMMNIAQRVYDVNPATESQYEVGTRKMITALNDMLPGGITVTMEDDEEAELEIDKLDLKRESGDGLGALQLNMKQCSTCGVMLPAAMDCAKPQCKKGIL